MRWTAESFRFQIDIFVEARSEGFTIQESESQSKAIVEKK